MELLRGISLVTATLSMGFVAAIFVHWSNIIMPGLKKTDDRTFVAAFQSIDDAFSNPLFLGFGFMGALLFTGLAGVLHLVPDRRSALPLIAAAFVLYLVAFIITVAINVPLNEDIKAAGDPDQIDNLAAVREQFNEAKWTAWNHVRAVVSTAGTGCLLWALVLFGRSI